jgi:hypothetical protein
MDLTSGQIIIEGDLTPEGKALLDRLAIAAYDPFEVPKASNDMRNLSSIPLTAALAVAGLPALTDADWSAITEAKNAEADRYYGRGHSAGHMPSVKGADKRRAKRKAARKARKAGR